jgi:hypothetical protein
MSSQAEIQEKISAARREADGLKEKIRAAKDQTADTSCKSTYLSKLATCSDPDLSSTGHGKRYPTITQNDDEAPAYTQRSSRQDIRFTLGSG